MSESTCDAVLHAAQTAMANNANSWYANHQRACNCGPKNKPLLPLLAALIDAARSTAQAIADNAWDDCRPIDAITAQELASACYRLGAEIINASQAPDAANWSLPSMSGKELV